MKSRILPRSCMGRCSRVHSRVSQKCTRVIQAPGVIPEVVSWYFSAQRGFISLWRWMSQGNLTKSLGWITGGCEARSCIAIKSLVCPSVIGFIVMSCCCDVFGHGARCYYGSSMSRRHVNVPYFSTLSIKSKF